MSVRANIKRLTNPDGFTCFLSIRGGRRNLRRRGSFAHIHYTLGAIHSVAEWTGNMKDSLDVY